MKKIFLALVAVAGFFTIVNAQTVIMLTPKGAQYQVLSHGTGPQIKLDDIVTFQVVQKTERDSVLFSSYNAGHPIQIKVQASQNVADLMDIFPLLSNKDSALVRVPADSVFKGHEQDRPAFLPAKSNIVFLLKIQKVQSLNEAIAERNAALQKMQLTELANTNNYIAANKIAALSLPSGLKYVITKPGTGRKALNGDTVLVNYTGRTLNGKVFDTSLQAIAIASNLQQPGRDYQPLKVVLGQNQVISGWEEGLRLLNEGAQATLIIPSNLAYGQQGAGQDIGPFSTLLFDLELIKISPGAARPTDTTISKTTTPTAKAPLKTTPKKTGPVKKKVIPK